MTTRLGNRPCSVADVVSRFARQKKFMSEATYGHVFARKVTELSGDDVKMDVTEEVLIALKRRKIISGRRMVELLAQHQREIRG